MTDLTKGWLDEDSGEITGAGELMAEIVKLIGFTVRGAYRAGSRAVGAIGGMFGGGDDADEGSDDGELDAIREHLEEMREALGAITQQWEAAADLADGLHDQLEEATSALAVVTSTFSTQHSRRTAANLGRRIAELSEQWDAAQAEAVRLNEQVRQIRTSVAGIERGLRKSMPEMFHVEQTPLASKAAPGAHAIYR